MDNMPYTWNSDSFCTKPPEGGPSAGGGCGFCAIGIPESSLPMAGKSGGGGNSPDSYTGCPILWPVGSIIAVPACPAVP